MIALIFAWNYAMGLDVKRGVSPHLPAYLHNIGAALVVAGIGERKSCVR